jgi:murein DD-endopeptidase MepM/ murein hydrolase activator NlpD
VFLAHEPRAIGLQFDGIKGQRVRINIERDQAGMQLFADLLRVVTDDDEVTFDHVASIDTDADEALFRLRDDGQFVLRIQPELLNGVRYTLYLQAAAVIDFPIEGLNERAILSSYGAPRDAGRRQHEGVDIFAPRNTPVLAVADGVASPRSSKLGGNTVWLRTGQGSFYFAHLERAAITFKQKVKAGDVIGYVGNSGNAITTRPHLHFGFYRRPVGAIDPTPMLGAREFAELPAEYTDRLGYAVTTAAMLNVRGGPSARATKTAELARGNVVRVMAVSGDWLRVSFADSQKGWIHSGYQDPLVERVETIDVEEPALVYPDPAANLEPIAVTAAAQSLDVFSRSEDALLVGEPGSTPLGWLLLR